MSAVGALRNAVLRGGNAMRYGRSWAVIVASIVVLSGCAQSPPGSSSTGAVAPGQVEQPRAERTLILAMRLEPATLSSRPLQSVGIKFKVGARLFTAGLDMNDDRGVAHPYLAEALPQLNTESC